ncbi:unnamed protein product [Cylindrotheca closterium]|uniref:Uncharacterized protein n=1 Tax=Cylindrotheca closterium TaxID=2856 RepID=A0AAD2G929_9STRA|nr:unnamed protein product [Cylindrotheca closterium]
MSNIFQPFSSSPLHRSLYDQDFIDAGCNATQLGASFQFVQLTQVDDTVGTWATNYAILALGVLGAFVFGCMKDPLIKYRRFAFSSSYFGFSGLGYGVAAVNHQIRQLETEPKFYWAAYILTTIGVMALQLQIGMNFKASNNPRHWYSLLVCLVGFAVILVIAVWGIQLVAGGYLVVSYLWFVLYFAVIKDWMASLGSIVCIAGFVVQFLFDPTCGTEAYPDCFQDCFLPDPSTFNHNGLFHVLLILGMFLQLFARFVPIIEQQQQEEVQESEGVRQDSKVSIDGGEVEPNNSA